MRAALYADAVDALEAEAGRSLMSRNIAAGRALHPLAAGAGAVVSMRRMGPEGCAILAEAGPVDPINRWTEERVFASTEVDAPTVTPMRWAGQPVDRNGVPIMEPERGC